MAQLALQPGATGPAVTLLQQALVGQGFVVLQVDGVYGPETKAAVAAFQDAAGLPSTGIVDGATAAQLGLSVPVPQPQGQGPIDFPGSNITVAIPSPPNNTPLLVLLGLAVGGVYYYSKKRGQMATAEYEEWEEPMPEEADDDDDEPVRRPRRRTKKAKLSDAVTDSLLDEPAIIAESGKPGDCYKAALLLTSRSALATTDKERKIYENVVHSVKKSCDDRGESAKAVQRAIHKSEALTRRVKSFFVQPGTSSPKKRIGKKSRREIKEDDIAIDIRPESAAPRAPKVRRPRGAPKKSSVIVKPREGEPYRLVREVAKDRPKGFRLRKEKL